MKKLPEGINLIREFIAIFFLQLLSTLLTHTFAKLATSKCEGGNGLKYIWGDALTDTADCVGPNNMPYPSSVIARSFRNSGLWTGSSRQGRMKNTIDPMLMRKALMKAHEENFGSSMVRTGT